MQLSFCVSSSTIHINHDKRTFLKAPICSFLQHTNPDLIRLNKKHQTHIQFQLSSLDVLHVLMQYRRQKHVISHNLTSRTFIHDFHQIEIDKALRFHVCSLPLWFLVRGCARMWLCVIEWKRKAPICTWTLTVTTNKWVWFITSFLLSTSSARVEGVNQTLQFRAPLSPPLCTYALLLHAPAHLYVLLYVWLLHLKSTNWWFWSCFHSQ